MQLRRMFFPAALLAALGFAVWGVAASLFPAAARSAPAAVWDGLGESAAPIVPIPRAIALDDAKVALGARLFADPRLSKDNTVSCASCHSLSRGGADGLARSVGIGGRQGMLNAPTVFNSGFNFRQFWNGRSASLEDQIDGPIENPAEMGSSWSQVVARVAADAGYAAAFAQAYPGEALRAGLIKDAIATYERSLITPDSRFDRYLRGEPGALTAREIEGYRKFRDYGCVSCHQGVNLGGNLYQRLGVMADFFESRVPAEQDLGRFGVTGAEPDIHVFKVPGLRNVALTAPYLHDGSAGTLEQAVRIMGRYQLGIAMNDDDVAVIVEFLGTLTGEYQGRPL